MKKEDSLLVFATAALTHSSVRSIQLTSSLMMSLISILILYSHVHVVFQTVSSFRLSRPQFHILFFMNYIFTTLTALKYQVKNAKRCLCHVCTKIICVTFAVTICMPVLITTISSSYFHGAHVSPRHK